MTNSILLISQLVLILQPSLILGLQDLGNDLTTTFQKFSGYSIQGTNLDVVQTGSVEKCKRICDATTECMGFNINENSVCSFKKQSKMISLVGTSDAYVSSKWDNPTYLAYKNMQFENANLDTKTDFNVGQCYDSCVANSNCQGFSLTGSNCYLKSGPLRLQPGDSSQTAYTLLRSNVNAFSKYSDYWIYGHSIQAFDNLQIADCVSRCVANANCIGFEYGEDSRLCELKSTFMSTIPANNMKQKVYLLNVALKTPERADRKYKCYNQVDSAYNDLLTIEGSITESECYSRCDMTYNCIATMFYDNGGSNNQCILKSYVFGMASAPSQTAKLCVVVGSSPPPRVYDYKKDTKYTNLKELGIYGGPYDECPLACDRTPSCVAFRLRYDWGIDCYLQGFVNGSTWSTASETGSHTFVVNNTRSSPSGSRIFIESPGFYYNGNDISSQSAGNTLVCQTACESAIECVLFEYNSGNRTCKLKSDISNVPTRHSNTQLKSYLTLDRRAPQSFTGEMPATKTLYRGDKLRSLNGKFVFQIEHDGKVSTSAYSVRVNLWPEIANSIGILADGRMKVDSPTQGALVLGTARTCTSGTWKLQITDIMEVKTVCSTNANTVGYSSTITSADFPFTAFKSITGYDVESFPFNANAGQNVKIFYLDSGVNIAYDPSLSLLTATGVNKFTVGTSYANVLTNDYDVWYHGTPLLMMAKSNIFGQAQAATVVSIKITEGEERFFSEKSLVRGIAYAVQDGTTNSKIINFSGAFKEGNSNVVNCAIQWAFNAGVSVIAAAGNDNKVVGKDTNPYQFIVGSYNPVTSGKSGTWSDSNFGDQIDIWAPNNIVSNDKIGTSYATGYVSAVLASAQSKYSSLAKNPNYAFKFLFDTANITAVDGRDNKAIKSIRAGVRSLSTSKITGGYTGSFSNYFDASKATDFCRTLGYTSPNWPALIERASANVFGAIVSGASRSGPTCQSTVGQQCG